MIAMDNRKPGAPRSMEPGGGNGAGAWGCLDAARAVHMLEDVTFSRTGFMRAHGHTDAGHADSGHADSGREVSVSRCFSLAFLRPGQCVARMRPGQCVARSSS